MSKSLYKIVTVVFLLAFTITSCVKDNKGTFSGAYKDSPVDNIKFIGTAANPESGIVGDEIKFKVAGLDSVNVSGIQFYLNGVLSTVKSYNKADSILTVVVPDFASSGAVKLIVNDKNFYGPIFNVKGKAVFDSTFNVIGKDELNRNILGTGANGVIRDIHYRNYSTLEYLFLVGDFTAWNGSLTYQPANNTYFNGVSNFNYLMAIDPVSGIFKNDITTAAGPNGRLYGIGEFTSYPGYMIYGAFSSYNKRGSGGINNITRIYDDAKLDSIVRNVYNPDPSITDNNMDTLPRFVGGFDNTVIRTFIDAKNRMICIGSFSTYYKNDYDLSTAKKVYEVGTPMKQVAALFQDGNLDVSYSYQPGEQTDGTNGAVADAVQITNAASSNFKKVVVVGNFTSYNGVIANRIFMLDDNGNADPSFNVGSGANSAITRITYNSVTRKLLVVGSFTQFNGTSTPAGIVMLNENGTVDASLNFGILYQAASNRGQLVNYAGQLNDGKIIISGSFERYSNPGSSDKITRQGFMIINADGSLTAGYNSLGAFNGQIIDHLETRNAANVRSVIIAGNFNLFDNKNVGNIAKLILNP